MKLKAELDFKRLGATLKGDMKKVAEKFRTMSDEELAKFQEEGSIDVFGHTLTTEDVRIKYAFDDDKKKGKSSVEKGNYDAYSDGEVRNDQITFKNHSHTQFLGALIGGVGEGGGRSGGYTDSYVVNIQGL